MKTIVIGWNVLFATLNQMNEKDQNIIDNITAPNIFTFLFNVGTGLVILIIALRIYVFNCYYWIKIRIINEYPFLVEDIR